MSGQSLGAMSHHTTLLEQGMLSWGPSCPMEVVGRPENRLFTLAKALEQPEGQISNCVIHFNHTIVTWSLAWGEVKKHQNLLVPPPPAGACILRLVPLQLPADGISLAVWLPTLGGFGYKFIFMVKKKKNLCTVFCCSYLLWNVSLFWETEQRWLQLFIAGEGVWIPVPTAGHGHGGSCLRVTSNMQWVVVCCVFGFFFFGFSILFQLLA